MKIESRLRFVEFIAGVIANYMDTKDRRVWTKAELCESITKAMWVINKKNSFTDPEWISQPITKGLVKKCVDYLNENGYVIQVNKAPPGYRLISGKRKHNTTPDILSATENIDHAKQKYVRSIETQVIRPGTALLITVIPEAYKANLITTKEQAEQLQRKILETTPLEHALAEMNSLKKISYEETLSPVINE